MTWHFPTAVLLIAAAAITCCKQVTAIKCYVCRSDENSYCADDVNNTMVVECPPRPQATGEYCRKISQQLIFKEEDDVTTIRECAYEKSTKPCYKRKWFYAVYQETCECDEDLCNGSSLRRPATAGPLFLTLAPVTAVFAAAVAQLLPVW